MAQTINIKVGAKSYELSAPTPEYEEKIRLAAKTVSQKIEGFLSRYPQMSLTDIMTFVALNENIAAQCAAQKLDNLEKETESLLRETDNYLSNIETSR